MLGIFQRCPSEEERSRKHNRHWSSIGEQPGASFQHWPGARQESSSFAKVPAWPL